MCEVCGNTAYELQGIEGEDGDYNVCESCYDTWEQMGECTPHNDYAETDVYLR